MTKEKRRTKNEKDRDPSACGLRMTGHGRALQDDGGMTHCSGSPIKTFGDDDSFLGCPIKSGNDRGMTGGGNER